MWFLVNKPWSVLYYWLEYFFLSTSNGSYQDSNLFSDQGNKYAWERALLANLPSYTREEKRADIYNRTASAIGYGTVKGVVNFVPDMGNGLVGLTGYKGPFPTWGYSNESEALVGSDVQKVVAVGTAFTGVGGVKGAGTTQVGNGANILRHYTSEASYNAIMKSRILNPSVGQKNARYGSGQYFTDLLSEGYTAGQVSRRLFGVPWNTSKLTHFIDVDVRGLGVIKNAQYNYLIPRSTPLPLGRRIINGGQTIFK